VLRLGALEGKQELEAQQNQASDGCDMLVFDHKQYFTVEVWERQSLRTDIMLGTSPVEGSHKMTLQDLLSRRGSHKSQWVALDAATGEDLGSRVRLRTTLFELHNDKKKLPSSSDSSPERTLARKPTRSVSSGCTASSVTAPRSSSSILDDTSAHEPSVAASASFNSSTADGNQEAESSLGKFWFMDANSSQFESPRKVENTAVALFILSVFKGRVPLEETESASRYILRASVTSDHFEERPFVARDTEFWKHVHLPETTMCAIEELSNAGFPAERIATMLKLDKELVAKVIAHRLKWNVELPWHLCVRVPKKVLSEERPLTLEVLKKGYGQQKAKGQVALSKVRGSNGMKLRSLVNLAEASDSAANRSDLKSRYDLDIEIRLLAFVPHQQYSRRSAD